MSDTKELPKLFLISQAELQHITQDLGEVPSKQSYRSLSLLETVSTRQVPEEIVKNLVASPDKEEPADDSNGD